MRRLAILFLTLLAACSLAPKLEKPAVDTPAQWRLLYSLNPMVGVIDGFRWCLLGGQSAIYLPGLVVSIAVAAFFLWFGIRRFRATEKSFADLI